MSWVVTISSTRLEGTDVVVKATYTLGAKSFSREFRFDIREKSLTSERVVEKVKSLIPQLEAKASIVVQLKALEGTEL